MALFKVCNGFYLDFFFSLTGFDFLKPNWYYWTFFVWILGMNWVSAICNYTFLLLSVLLNRYWRNLFGFYKPSKYIGTQYQNLQNTFALKHHFMHGNVIPALASYPSFNYTLFNSYIYKLDLKWYFYWFSFIFKYIFFSPYLHL